MSPTLRRFARLVVSAALIAFVLTRIDGPAALRIARAVRPEYVALLLTLSLFERAYGAWRWHQLLRERSPGLRLSEVLRITYESAFVGLVVPGAVGTYAMRAYGMARATADAGLSVASIVVDRLLVTVAMLSLAVTGVLAFRDRLPADFVFAILVIAALALLAMAVALLPATGRLLDRLLVWRWLAPVRRMTAASYEFVRRVRERPLATAGWFAAAFGLQVLRVAVVFTALRAMRVTVDPVALLFVVPVTMFALMVPISFAGLGVREVSFVWLLGMIGVAAEPAFATSLLIYVASTLTTLPGAVLLARRRVAVQQRT